MPDPESVEEADVALGKKLAGEKDDPWVRALVQVGKLGDQEPLYAYAACVIAAGLVSWNSRRARLGVSMLLSVAAADAGKRLLKGLVTRTRPHVLLDQGRYKSESGGSDAKPEQSFPSGHVACTVAQARAISRHKRGVAPWTTPAVAVIALARLAKGAHWPLDVAAGIVLGLLAEALSSRVLRCLRVPQAREEEHASSR
jgi:membrane-associated phospholipid phosphatase